MSLQEQYEKLRKIVGEFLTFKITFDIRNDEYIRLAEKLRSILNSNNNAAPNPKEIVAILLKIMALNIQNNDRNKGFYESIEKSYQDIVFALFEEGHAVLTDLQFMQGILSNCSPEVLVRCFTVFANAETLGAVAEAVRGSVWHPEKISGHDMVVLPRSKEGVSVLTLTSQLDARIVRNEFGDSYELLYEFLKKLLTDVINNGLHMLISEVVRTKLYYLLFSDMPTRHGILINLLRENFLTDLGDLREQLSSFTSSSTRPPRKVVEFYEKRIDKIRRCVKEVEIPDAYVVWLNGKSEVRFFYDDYDYIVLRDDLDAYVMNAVLWVKDMVGQFELRDELVELFMTGAVLLSKGFGKGVLQGNVVESLLRNIYCDVQTDRPEEVRFYDKVLRSLIYSGLRNVNLNEHLLLNVRASRLYHDLIRSKRFCEAMIEEKDAFISFCFYEDVVRCIIANGLAEKYMKLYARSGVEVKQLSDSPTSTVISMTYPNPVYGALVFKGVKSSSLGHEDLVKAQREEHILEKLRHCDYIVMQYYGSTEQLTDIYHVKILMLFVIMQRVEAQPLNQIVEDNNSAIDEKLIVKIFVQLFTAISFMHQRKIVHGGLIEPSNVMLTNDSKDIRVVGFSQAEQFDVSEEEVSAHRPVYTDDDETTKSRKRTVGLFIDRKQKDVGDALSLAAHTCALFSQRSGQNKTQSLDAFANYCVQTMEKEPISSAEVVRGELEGFLSSL